jgi:hypothetical protein
MLDFRAVRERTQTLQQLAGGLAKADLAAAMNTLYDDVQAGIRDVSDADITFPPVDPDANDEFASDTAEVGLAWTLGHVVVHLTASAEEAAFIATELARGVAREGRSRWETPWTSVETADAARGRLEESRRMIVAMLDVWPDPPHLDVTLPGSTGPRNAIVRFLSGLNHADSHLAQVSEIVRQAQAARHTTG